MIPDIVRNDFKAKTKVVIKASRLGRTVFRLGTKRLGTKRPVTRVISLQTIQGSNPAKINKQGFFLPVGKAISFHQTLKKAA